MCTDDGCLLTGDVGYGHRDPWRAIAWKLRPDDRFLITRQSEDAILLFVGSPALRDVHDV